jgi:uncharacterized membrane protein AbrB (regulator of aidB expression)
MPPFPQWGVAIIIAAGGIWLATKWNTEAAWYLTVIILLGVMLKRDAGLNQLDAFLITVFGRSFTHPEKGTIGGQNRS